MAFIKQLAAALTAQQKSSGRDCTVVHSSSTQGWKVFSATSSVIALTALIFSCAQRTWLLFASFTLSCRLDVTLQEVCKCIQAADIVLPILDHTFDQSEASSDKLFMCKDLGRPIIPVHSLPSTLLACSLSLPLSHPSCWGKTLCCVSLFTHSQSHTHIHSLSLELVVMMKSKEFENYSLIS